MATQATLDSGNMATCRLGRTDVLASLVVELIRAGYRAEVLSLNQQLLNLGCAWRATAPQLCGKPRHQRDAQHDGSLLGCAAEPVISEKLPQPVQDVVGYL